jgi:outer membrane protein OmpA-like peptidoglycan-associated protein
MWRTSPDCARIHFTTQQAWLKNTLRNCQRVGGVEVLKLSNVKAGLLAVVALILAMGFAGQASAQNAPQVAGKIQWGIWVDRDGCMHWWADGGVEGYMLDRVHPQTGKPVCIKRNTCLVQNTDQLFATDSAQLSAHGRAYLQQFFQSAGAFGYAVYGHTDSRASDEYNINLSQRRARAVADVARSVGAMVEREIGFGERQPVAPNDSAQNMALNRRVEIVCYRW